MANSFDTEREFVSRHQSAASYYYRDYFGEHERYPIEELSDGRLEKQLDYSGVDQIVKPHGSPKTIHVAQRFRRERSDGDTDFSIRVEVENGVTEYQKLMINHAEEIGHTPGAYAFGVVDGDGSFSQFYFLKVGLLVEALKQNAVRSERHANFVDGERDGTKAEYIPIEELRKNRICMAGWEDGSRQF